MATPKCPHCNHTSWESKTVDKIKNSNFKHTFIICANCGAPAGVLDYFNIGDQLKSLHTKVDKLAR